MNPEPFAVIPLNATAVEIAYCQACQKEALRLYDKYCAVSQALKNQVIKSVNKEYLKYLQGSVTGYNFFTVFDMLQHLYRYYGCITLEAVGQNYVRMKTPMAVTCPFIILSTHISDAAEFVDAGNDPYSEKQLIYTALLVVKKTGVFNVGVCKWCCRLQNKKPGIISRLTLQMRTMNIVQKLQPQHPLAIMETMLQLIPHK